MLKEMLRVQRDDRDGIMKTLMVQWLFTENYVMSIPPPLDMWVLTRNINVERQCRAFIRGSIRN